MPHVVDVDDAIQGIIDDLEGALRSTRLCGHLGCLLQGRHLAPDVLGSQFFWRLDELVEELGAPEAVAMALQVGLTTRGYDDVMVYYYGMTSTPAVGLPSHRPIISFGRTHPVYPSCSRP